MKEKEILDEVWKKHRENKDNSHELKEHFCRACLDLTIKLYKSKVRELIDNPTVNQIVMKRTTESWEEFRDRCYKAERDRIKEELVLQ